MEGKDVGKVGRFGVEVVVERVGGMIRDCNYIREVIIKVRKEGMNIKVVMVDYGGKVGWIGRDKEEFEGIWNVYIDIENVGEEMDLDIVWSGDDIRREGKKDRSSRYDENDMWGCIGIVGNGDRIVGVKCREEEEKDDIVGCELVVERDGLGSGRGLFKCDVERERCVEFSKEEGKE